MSNWVYTNENQCSLLGTSYYDQEAELSVRADTLLNSTNGYDEAHQNLLRPLGSKVVKLVRTNDMGPGWWLLSTKKR